MSFAWRNQKDPVFIEPFNPSGFIQILNPFDAKLGADVSAACPE